MTLPLVDEIKELADELTTALFFVQLDRFEDRSVLFYEAVACRDGAPDEKYVIAKRAVFWVEVAESWQ